MTKKYLRSLSRKTDSRDKATPVHIYFKKRLIQVYNLSVLAALPGLTFESINCGNAQSWNNTVLAIVCPEPPPPPPYAR